MSVKELKRILVDTDGGVDDCMALICLFLQNKYPLKILGITTVAGNTEVWHARRNVAALLSKLTPENIPIIAGAAQPLQEKRSYTGAMLHGLDGLWSSTKNFLIENDTKNQHDSVQTFWKEMLQQHQKVELLCLGPLTNLAIAEKNCPGLLKKFSRITCLGSSKYLGSYTPLAEYNFGQDPEAAKIVLDSGAFLHLVPLDTHQQFRISLKEFKANCPLEKIGLEFLIPAVEKFMYFNQDYFQTAEVKFPDLVAALLAIDDDLGKKQSTLVKMITESGLARGQSVVCLNNHEKLTCLATPQELSELCKAALQNPNFNLPQTMAEILARESDNAMFYTEINHAEMKKLFFEIFELAHDHSK